MDDDVRIYDASGNPSCNLSDHATTECLLDYSIYVKTINGTIGVIGSGTFTWKSECWKFKQIYDSGSRSDFWKWDDNAAFLAGYEVRDTSTQVKLPQLDLKFPSNNPISVCGPI